MKIINKTLFFLITCFLIGCDHVSTIYLINKTNRSVCVISPELGYGLDVYPDTIIPLEILKKNIRYSSDSTQIVYESLSGWYHEFLKKDTVSIYIFDNDTVNFYSWDTIIAKNIVLQRYDISLEDVNSFCINKFVARLYFPPSEDMKRIHMWPPYGTYDETGQIRIKQRTLK